MKAEPTQVIPRMLTANLMFLIVTEVSVVSLQHMYHVIQFYFSTNQILKYICSQRYIFII